MPNNLLVGIDLGTTVLKAAAFDKRTGRMLGASRRRLPITTGSDGRREQDPAAIIRALTSVMRDIKKHLAHRFGSVAGIGVAAQGGSGIIAHRHTGKAFTTLMLWNDTRAFSYLPRIRGLADAGYWKRLSWRDEPGWGLARLTYLKETYPELFVPENIYVGAGEYLFFKMTGVWRQDACNALQIGCYNVPRRRLDPRPLSRVGVELSFVAGVREGHEIHPLSREGARLLGLARGTPVAGPYMDHEAGYMSALEVSRHPLQCSLGTAWVGNFILGPDTKCTSPFQLVIPSPVGNGWLVIAPLLTGNVTWDWCLTTLVHPDHKTALKMAGDIFRKSLLAPDGLTALPWFNMPNPVWPGIVGGGTFFGLSPHTDRADMVRALGAAMTYEMARMFAEVREKSAVDSVVLGGGASSGAFFRQLLATLLRPLPVAVFKEEAQSGTRGVLHAFGTKASRALTVAVKPASGRIAADILRGYERYMDVFEKLYGKVKSGGAIRLAARKKGGRL